MYYTSVTGDYLEKIGEKFNVPWQDILKANESVLGNDLFISAGTTLFIPDSQIHEAVVTAFYPADYTVDLIVDAPASGSPDLANSRVYPKVKIAAMSSGDGGGSFCSPRVKDRCYVTFQREDYYMMYPPTVIGFIQEKKGIDRK